MLFVFAISALMVPLVLAVVFVPLSLALRFHRAEQRHNVARSEALEQQWATDVVQDPVLVYGA